MSAGRYTGTAGDRRVESGRLGTAYLLGQRVHCRVASAYEPRPQEPMTRRLRIFASDPGRSRFGGGIAVADVPYEPLEPGPVGRLVEVDGTDVRSGDVYAPADLESHVVLLGDGHAPSEADPRFHAQMVYAVTNIVHARFRRALGRQVGWAFGNEGAGSGQSRLRLRPFAANEANAWYDPDDGSLNFGYFAADLQPGDRTLSQGRVFTSLSHDIIAHETTHALLDALRSNFRIPSSNDMAGFHEGFADLVALFHHFLHRDALRTAIVESRGDLRRSDYLSAIGSQFGRAAGRADSLRSAVRSAVRYDANLEPHAMGELLLAAVYDAFVTVFDRKVAVDLRLASGGTGRLPEGELPDLLVERLAHRARQLAGQFLSILIRAVDYLPPVDVRLGEYLRALITADVELVHDDPWGYREALVDAFRLRGIHPRGVASLSEDSLLWRGPRVALAPIAALAFREIRFRGDPGVPVSVGEQVAQACALGEYITQSPVVMREFGLVAAGDRELGGDSVDLPVIESVRTLRRPGREGRVVFDTVAEVLQRRRVGARGGHAGFDLWGGSTVIVNSEGEVRLLVLKSVVGEERIERRLAFLESRSGRRFWDLTGGRFVEKGGPGFRRLCTAPATGSADERSMRGNER